MHVGVAGVDRKLGIDHVSFGLQRRDIVDEGIVFVFVEARRVVGCGPEVSERRLVRIVGNLELAVGGARKSG